MNWYIKARYNPQLENPYYIAYGKLSKAVAKKKGKTLYGTSIMMSFPTEQEYRDKISELKIDGFDVREGEY